MSELTRHEIITHSGTLMGLKFEVPVDDPGGLGLCSYEVTFRFNRISYYIVTNMLEVLSLG